MSELHVGYIAQSTEEVLRRVQSTLLPFAERPENYNFACDDVDTQMLVYGGLGTVVLSYNRRSMAHVSFASESGFEVTAAYRLHTGIYVDALPLHAIGALSVRYPEEEDAHGSLYTPYYWPDGGYSLRGPGAHNLDIHTVWHIGSVVSALANPSSLPAGTHLSVVE